MSRLLTVSLALAIGLGVPLAGCDRQSEGTAQQQEAPAPAAFEPVSRKFAGESMPQFTAKDPAGKVLELPKLAGTPVLLNVWATWCAPCKAEMPILDAIAAEHQGKLRVVTVSQDTKGAEDVMPFFEEGKFTHLEPWLDPELSLASMIGANDLPVTLLFDASGKEVARVTGKYDWEGEEAKALIAETMGS